LRELRQLFVLNPYRVTDDGVLLDKATEAGDDPFAAFSECTSVADEKAYGGLYCRASSLPLATPRRHGKQENMW
jgi:hypothetical protein